MSAFDFKTLIEHIGHKVEVVIYARDEIIYDVAIECEDCNEVLVDYENPDLE
jgi:hypothetical protein